MRILGIDPGLATVGYGVIEYNEPHFSVLGYGAVTTPAHTEITKRLSMIYDDISALIARYDPTELAIEELFFNTNATTGIAVAEARGVILLSAVEAGVPIAEYTPLQIKQSVVGYGRAEKHQVIAMVTQFLHLPKPPKPDDTADALAAAITHAYTGSSRLAQFYNKPTEMKNRVR